MAQTEAEAEIEKMKVLEERIKAPSIWCQLSRGIRFEDLQDSRYDEAAQLLKEHYIAEEVTYRSVNIIDDEEGAEEFINNARIWMKDKMSIAAVNEETDELSGILIMRLQEKSSFSRTFSRVKLTYNINYGNIMKFINEIEKPVDLYDEIDVRKYLKIYALAISSKYRHKGLGKEMLKSAVALAASANVPAIAGIFLTNRIQKLAEDLGFKKYNEVLYTSYLINEQVLITDTGENNSAALMAFRIPYVHETAEIHQQQASRFTINEVKEGTCQDKQSDKMLNKIDQKLPELANRIGVVLHEELYKSIVTCQKLRAGCAFDAST